MGASCQVPLRINSYSHPSIANCRFLQNEILNSDTSEALRPCCDYLKIQLTEDEIEKFYNTMKNSDFDIVFQDMQSNLQVMTVFGSKGLEFDQVISFSSYYSIHNNEHLQNHYVCITRAKEKFVMFIDDNGDYESYIKSKISEKGMENHKLIYSKIEISNDC